jgi:hypothetical protein
MGLSAIVGHAKFPTWRTLWAQINRRVDRLERIYAGVQRLDNTGDLEDDVDALLLCITHLSDWMLADAAVGQSLKEEIRTLTGRDPLKLARDYANTFKHHTYRPDPKRGVRRYARLHEAAAGASFALSLRSWMDDESGADQSVDALAFAQQCIAEWRRFFATHGIDDPQPK